MKSVFLRVLPPTFVGWETHYQEVNNMARDILCAIDFSETSRDSLRWSVDFAKKSHQHLTVLFAYRLNRSANEAIEAKRRIEHEAKVRFAQLESELLQNQGITYDFKVEVGFVSDRVEWHVRTRPIALLVMDKDISISNRELLDELVSRIEVPLVIVPHLNPTLV